MIEFLEATPDIKIICPVVLFFAFQVHKSAADHLLRIMKHTHCAFHQFCTPDAHPVTHSIVFAELGDKICGGSEYTRFLIQLCEPLDFLSLSIAHSLGWNVDCLMCQSENPHQPVLLVIHKVCDRHFSFIELDGSVPYELLHLFIKAALLQIRRKKSATFR